MPAGGRHAVVVGRSVVVGKPAAHLLLDRHATATVCHSRTADLPAITRQADVLVAAAGPPH
jgi:methylenetetrahydrofolate dehydrogenase (NADP+)/methenyltetrahydrofolate cyclohydrolase